MRRLAIYKTVGTATDPVEGQTDSEVFATPTRPLRMDDFDLDLGAAEREMEGAEDGRVVLGVLDGGTPPKEWLAEVQAGNVLVLAVEGDLNERAAGFAGDVKDAGGTLVHFRGFLVVAPPEYPIDSDRLG